MSIKVALLNEPIIARSFSFLWIKRIYLGSKWLALPTTVKSAVLEHERAHCDGHHSEMRMLALLVPVIIPWLCRWQELRADARAVEAGFGSEMLWLLRDESSGGPFHPTNLLRREKVVHNKLFDQPTSRAIRYSA